MVEAMKTSLGPLELNHPIINASGTYDLLEADELLKTDLFTEFPYAAYVPKTVTMEPREGNAPPRVFETAAGLLNSIGLANKGIEAFIDKDLPRLAALPVPLVASIAGERTDDYGRCTLMLEDCKQVDAIELNVSCPNLELGGLALGCDPDKTRQATTYARESTSKFLIVKLTPNVTDIVSLARAAVEGGADCVSVINTVQGMALDPLRLKPALGHVTGGLSGPAIKPVALRAVYMISRELEVPVIGMGGATAAQDVLEFLAAGASAVAIGTASFRDPMLAARLLGALRVLVEQRGFASVRELVGFAHRE